MTSKISIDRPDRLKRSSARSKSPINIFNSQLPLLMTEKPHSVYQKEKTANTLILLQSNSYRLESKSDVRMTHFSKSQKTTIIHIVKNLPPYHHYLAHQAENSKVLLLFANKTTRKKANHTFNQKLVFFIPHHRNKSSRLCSLFIPLN